MLVRTESAAGVATLTLDRPRRHNSLVPRLLTDLLTAVEGLPDETRAVVLAAEGRSFSTGGDVRAFAERAGLPVEGRPRAPLGTPRSDEAGDNAGDEAGDKALAEYADEIVGLLNRAVLALLRLEVPTVAAVHGPVTGGSLGLVLAADIVLAGPEASFAPWYTVVGFGPDGGWTALLPERIGRARATAVQLLNETIDAPTAVAWGLAHGLHDDVRRAARDTAAELTGRRAVAVAKRLLTPDLDTVAARLEAERRAFVRQVTTPEAREGMIAFLSGGDSSEDRKRP
ncbi:MULTISPECIES: enoyl-CoA hydratase/isomerase family protein [unclassified Spirillospora]|uniref:enoyl-CoA hydratase/isomerase family protein n=1 Tax=unclassified Spirillospora TaxID=2642701 RepID=UPI003714731F